ncbi:hypothetical protein C8Q75DRAFT_806120 [Abortiporus biennis]|nr:hypothetical protein C8Q75DRAFT_806120 [Abortiporus biennis]
MLHSFVTAKLLPNLPSWVTYGLRTAERLVTTPFLALHVHNPSGPSPTAEYFALNHTKSGVRSLTVHPPLPFNGPLYLLITPHLAGQFPEADNDPSKLFSESEPHQFEEHSLSLFSEALNSTKPSILDERNTGGDDEPGENWDTWIPFDFQLLPLDVLPPEFETHLFEEIPLALPKLISTGRLFRTPSLPTLRPCTASLLSLPVIHDGDPNPIKGPQDDIADDWRDDIDAPDVELAVAEIIHAFPLGNIKVFIIDPTCLVDVNSPLKHALVVAFPPSEYAFNPKELLSLYVEYEGIHSADPNSHSSSMNIVLDVAQYLGAKVEGSHIKQAFKKTYTFPDLYEDAQKAVDLLSQCGYLCSLLSRFNLTLVEPIQSIRGLSTQFTVNNKEATFSWDSLFSFLQHSDSTLSRDQVLIGTPDLYCTAEAASRAGFPTTFMKRDDSRS